MTETKRIKIGIISDTHGLLRPEVVEILKNCDYIFHAGCPQTAGGIICCAGK